MFDAQECVNLLIAAANRDIDIKFGVTINDQLSDEILVSIIASDFENEVDFGQPISYTQPKPVEDATIFNSQPVPPEEPVETPRGNDFTDDDILPNFLKNDD